MAKQRWEKIPSYKRHYIAKHAAQQRWANHRPEFHYSESQPHPYQLPYQAPTTKERLAQVGKAGLIGAGTVAIGAGVGAGLTFGVLAPAYKATRRYILSQGGVKHVLTSAAGKPFRVPLRAGTAGFMRAAQETTEQATKRATRFAKQGKEVPPLVGKAPLWSRNPEFATAAPEELSNIAHQLGYTTPSKQKEFLRTLIENGVLDQQGRILGTASWGRAAQPLTTNLPSAGIAVGAVAGGLTGLAVVHEPTAKMQKRAARGTATFLLHEGLGAGRRIFHSQVTAPFAETVMSDLGAGII